MTVKLWNLLSFTAKEEKKKNDGRRCACPPEAKHLVGTCQTIVTSHQGETDVGLHQNDRQQRHLSRWQIARTHTLPIERLQYQPSSTLLICCRGSSQPCSRLIGHVTFLVDGWLSCHISATNTTPLPSTHTALTFVCLVMSSHSGVRSDGCWMLHKDRSGMGCLE